MAITIFYSSNINQNHRMFCHCNHKQQNMQDTKKKTKNTTQPKNLQQITEKNINKRKKTYYKKTNCPFVPNPPQEPTKKKNSKQNNKFAHKSPHKQTKKKTNITNKQI